ncbi:hydratase [Desulfovibrio sp. 86]|uniref:Putative enzyme n=1 Tax=uncultured Desulfovibrio sp. TaxID=167968 RepID=A0A212L6K9_9BACT|nr:hydratase [Desulfovibrio sp. 86]SCM73135.1 putative enzyme [uncultured Desulfovibrio sp.]VZH33960.1 putative enzyme [Desulfovibrio sp. 86]
MIELISNAVVIDGNTIRSAEEARAKGVDVEAARKNSLAARILAAHNTVDQNAGVLRIRFDALASHDITYVGIVQTARASGLTEFPVPYALTNCHNSLCAVGGTINEDDHLFGLAAAQKYGGIFVPPHLAVIHQYVREMMTKCGGMILGSDSHTRYGALGVMAIGEGGPELVKQLLGKTYDVANPQKIAVWLEGAPRPGVGPQDVALALIAAVFKNGFVKNKVLEFMGPGVEGLSVEYRCGIDVMTTETTCLSSIWTTDAKVLQYLEKHGRAQDYAELRLEGPACYDGLIRIDLGKIVPMIALPFHPSNAYPVAEVVRHAPELLAQVEDEARKQFGDAARGLNLCGKIRDGGVWVDQGIIAGCAGGSFENITLAAAILDGKSTGNLAFSLSVYPASEPQGLALVNNGSTAKLMAAGAVLKNAFCGPCFGAGDTPAHGALSIRHTTRNFPNREGSKPSNGQLSAVALMDARSIAATAANGGRLTPATDLDWAAPGLADVNLDYRFEPLIYHRRVYNGFGHPKPEVPLIFGPNIADWPAMSALTDHLLLQVASVITDPVTTTDELIPSGETSSLRSNPLKLAEYTLSRKDPDYVGRAKAVDAMEKARLANPADPELVARARALFALCGLDIMQGAADLKNVGIGSTIFAVKPGDGSAREQAASCQKVLGGWANLAVEYATKRYRSNLINWGMLPFITDADLAATLKVGDWLAVPNVRRAVQNADPTILAYVVRENGSAEQIALTLKDLTDDERQIILDGCLINFYNSTRKQ